MAVALTINCCLKPSPNSPPSSTRSTLTPPYALKVQISEWRKRCVATMACVLISSTGAGITCTDGHGHDFKAATAMEITPMIVGSAGTRMVRWSDKRSCPPWHQNLLENIVPENLPRPSNSRRPNTVTTRQTGAGAGAGADRDSANTIIGGKLIGFQFDKSCFSL